jgi:hypothetical protein
VVLWCLPGVNAILVRWRRPDLVDIGRKGVELTQRVEG